MAFTGFAGVFFTLHLGMEVEKMPHRKNFHRQVAKDAKTIARNKAKCF
jgi:hypothetical protein